MFVKSTCFKQVCQLLLSLIVAQSTLKCKFPSVDKPLRIKAPPKISPSKRPMKNISPGPFFRNFTVGLVRKEFQMRKGKIGNQA